MILPMHHAGTLRHRAALNTRERLKKLRGIRFVAHCVAAKGEERMALDIRKGTTDGDHQALRMVSLQLARKSASPLLPVEVIIEDAQDKLVADFCRTSRTRRDERVDANFNLHQRKVRCDNSVQVVTRLRIVIKNEYSHRLAAFHVCSRFPRWFLSNNSKSTNSAINYANYLKNARRAGGTR